MIAHIMGVPIEESVLQIVAAGAAMMTVITVAGRASLGRLRRRRPGSGCLDGRHSAKPCRGQLHSPQIKHDGTTP